jgi:glyoxylase-like metal-dependent hydrolase (beta-lactamase superfamily II)
MSSSMPASAFVASRPLGEATVSVISDGSGRSTIIKMLTVPEAEWRREVPEADADGEVTLGYNVAHVRLGTASILIDLGFDDPSPASPWRAPRHQRSPGVEAGLATLGVRPETITHVLITHAHGDHVAGGSVAAGDGRRPRFPHARHLIGRADWETNPARSQPDSLLAQHLGPVAAAGLLEMVDAEREVVPGVTMLAAPGESPGHCIVRVQSGGATFYFLGDLFHHPVEVVHLDWVSQGRDAAAMLASRRRLVAGALASDALLVASHIPFPGFGRLRQTAEGLRWTPA